MIAVVQRVKKATVTVEEDVYSNIGEGLLVLLGIEQQDTPNDSSKLSAKIPGLRIFGETPNEKGLLEIEGKVMVVSQFTLLADCKKGRRPSYSKAARPDIAEDLYNGFVSDLKKNGLKVETGKFGAIMQIDFVNDGPFTIILNSKDL